MKLFTLSAAALATIGLLAAGAVQAERAGVHHGKPKHHHHHGKPGTRDPGVNARQHRQAHRTAQGVRSGELTRDEVKEIRGERREIRQLEREYKSDGKLTRDERKDLHKELNEASRNIYQEKHDDEKRK